MREKLSERVQTKGHMNRGGIKSNICHPAQKFKKMSFHLFSLLITLKIDIYEKKNLFNNIIILAYHDIQNNTK